MRLKELIRATGILEALDLIDFEVAGISSNSKSVKDNFIFVAVKGARDDGARFINDAVKRGARLVVASELLEPCKTKVPFIKVKDTRACVAKLAAQFYGNPSLNMKVVGITGTNGKTTITYLIESLLSAAGFVPGVIGTINYRFCGKEIPSVNTTPGPVELQSMLYTMFNGGVNYAVMEVSSHALDQGRTSAVNFSSAIFTNLTQDHLDYHKTLKSYFKCKAMLFQNLSPDAFAVLNNDDPCGVKLYKMTKAKVVTYGIKNSADIVARNIRFDCAHTEFELIAPLGKINLRSGLIGRHNVYNLLAAAAWGYKEGLGLEVIKSGLEKFSSVPGRLERIVAGKSFSVFVDYAHTEDALKNILGSLRPLCRKKMIVVFGCGGERDKSKRPKMGRVVTELSDYAIVTNDNPRHEDPNLIIEDIRKGIIKNNYCIIPERSFAIKMSLALAKPGDIVLIAGKGHENYQILKDKVLHFDDREEIRECLKSLNY
jgi:UDP-N-acetylmuramoyl-L-alanyl-D-glutamate--2,6-diaminopimelate ligase